MMNSAFWDVIPCGTCMNRVSEERSTTFNLVTRIDKLVTTLGITSNGHTKRRIVCENGSVSMEYKIEVAERSVVAGNDVNLLNAQTTK
jgi:hypothetical protein